jgi:hypothetical protein
MTAARSLTVISPREASIFAALVDTVVAPAPPLPPVRDTDAAFAMDAGLAAAPAINRLAVRVALLALELAPFACGRRHRLRRLTADDRAHTLDLVERGPLAGAVKGLRALAHLSYYGDPGVARLLGYDADAVVARGQGLREREVRW